MIESTPRLSMNIKPIKTEADYDAALDEIERLWGAPLGTPEGDKLDVLATLVEAYEQKHHPIYPPDPVSAIQFRMEQLGLSRKDLEPYLGSRSRISEIFNRQRELSINMIRRLHKGLGIPLESLIADSDRAA
jgi:HTH-type transcriptional regulator/antitoxin HigA